MPLYRRLPKRGFSNHPFKKDLVEVNVGRIQQAVDAGKLDAKATVDAAALIAAGVIRRERDGISLLSNGELSAKLDLHVYRASKGAAEAIEKAGGSLKTDYVPKRKRERGGK
jgi:large subunit ribosomal protein L15